MQNNTLLRQNTRCASNILDVWMHLGCCYYGCKTHDNGQEGGVKGNSKINSLQRFGLAGSKQHSWVFFVRHCRDIRRNVAEPKQSEQAYTILKTLPEGLDCLYFRASPLPQRAPWIRCGAGFPHFTHFIVDDMWASSAFRCGKKALSPTTTRHHVFCS